MSEKLEVSRRTIYRDLDTLTLAGIPIVSYPGYGGGISIADGYRFDKSILSNEELKNIIAGLNAINSIDESKKIEYLIGKISPKNMDSINVQNDIIIDLSQWFDDDTQEMINSFRKAIANRLCVFIEYHSKSIVSQRTINPYHLVFKEANWYLYGFCKLRNAFRLFKINQIGSYTLLTNHFIPQKIDNLNFNLTSKYPTTKIPQETNEQVILEYKLEDKDFLIQILGAQNFKEEDGKGIITFHSINIDTTLDLVIGLQDKVKVIMPISLKK